MRTMGRGLVPRLRGEGSGHPHSQGPPGPSGPASGPNTKQALREGGAAVCTPPTAGPGIVQKHLVTCQVPRAQGPNIPKPPSSVSEQGGLADPAGPSPPPRGRISFFLKAEYCSTGGCLDHVFFIRESVHRPFGCFLIVATERMLQWMLHEVT